MPRNLDTRVELLTPIRDEGLRADLTTPWTAASRTT